MAGTHLFYGWRIAGAAAGLQFLVAALLIQAFGGYVAMLSEERGWSKTALAGGAALQAVEGALLGPLLGWLVDRFGPRVMLRTGVVMCAIGFFGLSRVNTLPAFYAAVMVIAVGTNLSGYFALSVSLMHWFRRWRTRALAIASLGFAMGGIGVPLVGWVMQTHGWRAMAMVSGAIFLVVGWPLASMVRGSPAEMGEQVDGIAAPALPEQPEAKSSEPAPEPEPEFTAAQAVRTRSFWLLGFGHALALTVVFSVNVHALSHLKEGLGYPLAQGALLITLMTLMQGAGVLLGGARGDRWNKRYVAAACMLAHTVGLLALTYANHPWMLVAFAVLHGGAWGLRGPFMQAMRADYFGLRAIGMIMGFSAILTAVGQIAGPLIAGAFADATGHYRHGFTLLAGFAALGSVMFFFATKPVAAAASAGRA